MPTISSVFREYYFTGAYKRNSNAATVLPATVKQLASWTNGTSFVKESQPIANPNAGDTVYFFSKNKNSNLAGLSLNGLVVPPESLIEYLRLEQNQLNPLPDFPALKNLIELAFHTNSISDLSPISSLGPTPKLTLLSFHTNSISDLSPISSLGPTPKLTLLSFHTNSISDLSPISSLGPTPNLNLLSFHTNSISDLSPISSLGPTPNLTLLSFHTNSISDLSPISSLGPTPNLTLLSFHTNSISNLSPISSLGPTPNLTDLYFHTNSISDLSPLDNLYSTNLINFEANSNALSSTEIIRVAQLLNTKITTNKSRTINFFSNPGSAAAAADSNFISARNALVAKGCIVTI